MIYKTIITFPCGYKLIKNSATTLTGINHKNIRPSTVQVFVSQVDSVDLAILKNNYFIPSRSYGIKLSINGMFLNTFIYEELKRTGKLDDWGFKYDG